MPIENKQIVLTNLMYTLNAKTKDDVWIAIVESYAENKGTLHAACKSLFHLAIKTVLN